MAHSTRFAVLAVAALLLALLPERHAAPAAADLCALSGLPPKKPVVPPHRCPAAAELSCCADCADTNRALQLVSSTLDDVAQRIDPNIPCSGIIDLTPMVCDAFQPYPQCMLMIEKIICGATCNPGECCFIASRLMRYSGTYVVKKGGEISMTVCQEFANAAYKACKDIEIQGVAMNQLIPDVQNMMVYVTNYYANFMGIENFSIAIGTPRQPTPPAAIPSPSTPSVPRGLLTKSRTRLYINRTIDSATCMSGAPQPAPAPSPPRDAPAPPAPGAAAPAPSLISPGAPAPAVIAPGAPAPAPPAPTAGVPGAPSPPASPSPTPASPSFPPPPPKAGAGSAASVMSLVALAVGAAVFV
ncbi:unnamed protein product [Closterium sp. NIES-65]|nr:unnamed protein product [Closterium sp. NIES-65]